MEFKGSKTEANLHTAFAGESEARNKYTYYAGIAKKEGYNQIASIFEETAGNEKEHAKIWFKILMSGGIPHASLPDTMANLKDAAAGEHYEWTIMHIRKSTLRCVQLIRRYTKIKKNSVNLINIQAI
jgi:rubrerythrin